MTFEIAARWLRIAYRLLRRQKNPPKHLTSGNDYSTDLVWEAKKTSRTLEK